MIIKGGAAGNVGWWGAHLQRDDTNDRAEVMEISGLLSTNLPSALREMEAIAAQSRSGGNFMYQANINPRDDERLTEKQWKEAIDTLENHLGLGGHQRIIVEHEKEGRVHRHVVWNRVDVETLRVADIGGNYYTHERVARTLEVKFDLQRTASLHGERNPDGRPDRAEELWQHRAAERSGIDPKQVTAELTDLWRKTDTGKAFAAALEERGYILAQGDRRNFCVVDHAGDAHSLARRIEGVKAKDVGERLADIDRATLPTVDEARAAQREKYPTHEAARTAWEGGRAEGRTGDGDAARDAPQPSPTKEQERPEKRVNPTVADIRLSWSQSPTGAAFAAALKDEGYILARVTPDEARASERAHAFAAEIGNFAPKYRDGEIVVVNERGGVYRLDAKTTGADRATVETFTATIDRAALPSLAEAKATQLAHAEQTKQREPWHDRAATRMEERLFRIHEAADRGGASVAAGLHAEGITLARVDAAGKEAVQRDYQRQFEAAREAGKDGARLRHAAFKEGELVAVTRHGDVHRLNPRYVELDRLERAATGGASRTPTLSAAREYFATAAQERKAQRDAEHRDRQQQWKDDRAAARDTIREAKETQRGRDQAGRDIKGGARETVRNVKDAGLKVVDAGGAVSSLSSFVESLLGMGGGRPEPSDGNDRIRQQRRAAAALEEICDSIERGENLRASDLESLTPTTLENIKRHGDDYIREMIADLERDREREQDYGRTRER
jgi:hypothetical protein